MAVGTAHVAFRDLRKDAYPRLVHGEDYDVVGFGPRVTMVKVEYHDVRLSTVDARVGSKVLSDSRAVLFTVAFDARDFLSDVGLAIAKVMRSSIGRVTWSAATLARSFRLIGECEGRDWFDRAAVVATFGLGQNIEMRGLKDGGGHEGTSRGPGRSFLRRMASRTTVLSERYQKSKRSDARKPARTIN